MTYRIRILAIVPLASLVLTGCPTKINPESQGLTCDPATDVCQVVLTLTPQGTTYTNGSVPLKVEVMPSDHPPDTIQLRRNEEDWMAVKGPSFSFMWNTAADAEGQYRIVAEASIGGHVVSSNVLTVNVDRTAPTVQLQPKPTTTNVALRDPIQVVFSEPVDPTTVSTTAVKLATGLNSQTDLGASSTLSTDHTTLTVTLGATAALTFPATITGTIDPTIKDLAGNAVTGVPTWSWTAPLWVKLPSFLGSTPSLSQGPNGPLLAYLQPATAGSGGNPTFGIARYAVGSTWDTSIATPTSTPIDSLAAIVDPTGTPIVAWGDPNDSHVRVAKLAGLSWTTFGTTADVGLSGASWRVSSLALDSTGLPTVAITGSPQQMGSPVGHFSRWSGSAWQLLDPSVLGVPLIAMDSTGAPVALSNGALQRYSNGSWLSIPLGSLQPLPTLALDSLDRPVLASETISGTTSTLTVYTFVQNAWQALGLPVAMVAAQIIEAHVAIAPGDIPVVAWTQTNGSGQDVHVARYNAATGAWVTTFDVINALSLGGGRAADVQVVVDSAGRPCVSWDEINTAGTTSVYTWMSNL